ncbi:hypothetical protein F8O01_03675 [Pseudoclavibacter chungangensis]|uniref:Uncharacterized protein n=1 Tax=Pseudoclavibacter chungangensis TaxID=587635 RepID=A0A7J5BZG4_9MICO|nr:hypothetical protein [Pseudoclavibacter chungangensis]KAB1660042.1 hypothetical protein F8O01_03675 [Pseudoclavibacter chungangensis]NYJ66864.1 hypothetical protein [Pseudoclavibacter chungangensis]
MSESTRMRDQPALTTSPGTSWIVVAAVTFALCGAVFVLLIPEAPVFGWVAIGVLATLLVAMLVVRYAVRPGPRRLVPLAVLYCSMVGFALIAVLAVGAGAIAGSGT